MRSDSDLGNYTCTGENSVGRRRAEVSVSGEPLPAVITSPSSSHLPHSYSLHSWCGLLTIILATAQWSLGLVTFLWPGLASHLRSFFLPIHIFVGLTIFIMACATALMGITEKAIFSLGDQYKVLIAVILSLSYIMYHWRIST